MARAGQVLLLTMLLVMLVMGRSGNPHLQALKMRISDAVSPVLSTVSAPFDAFRSVTGGMKNWALTYQQNQTLKAENRELLQWQAVAKDMKVENEKLRGLLNVAPRKEPHFVTATIVSDHGSAFSSAAIVSAGAAEGVAPNQAVISERGLVGRVVGAGESSAKVLLLTDINSRIPVMNERTREKMILVGKGTSLPTLSYVATDTSTKKGDRIITSGDGGVFPKNIAVGQIRDADKAHMQVDLFVNMADVEYVSVVQYDR